MPAGEDNTAATGEGGLRGPIEPTKEAGVAAGSPVELATGCAGTVAGAKGKSIMAPRVAGGVPVMGYGGGPGGAVRGPSRDAIVSPTACARQMELGGH